MTVINARGRRLKHWGAALVMVAPLLGMSGMAKAAPDGFAPATHPETAKLVDELVAKGLDRDRVTELMNQADYSQKVLDAMSRPAEGHLRWDQYRAIFMKESRIEAGVKFIAEHRETFDRAQAEYGVPPEVIAAIIGVETFFGKHTGTHRVIDSLSTLAFDHPRRGTFFRGELAAFLQLTLEQGIDPLSIKGSYAGAMGYPQFIPTSYQAYAVDFDGDGVRDLWHNPVDAIGSVGNYFARHGWKAGAPVVSAADGPGTPPSSVTFNKTKKPYMSVSALEAAGVQVAGDVAGNTQVIPLALDLKQGYRYAVGYDNFYVITRYNHSHMYAMAVDELSQAIKRRLEDGGAG